MIFPVIDMAATGENIKRLREKSGYSVHDVQEYFGFDGSQAVYRWQEGRTLPSVDSLYALSTLLGVTMKDILVPVKYTVYSNLPQHRQQSGLGSMPRRCDDCLNKPGQ